MMDADNWTEIRSDCELEYGMIIVVTWDETKGENWIKYEIIR